MDQSLVRRQPCQVRSREKVELILEATIEILDKEGLEALTTNRIAEVAGISIGTLYQYFSNKQQVVDELAQRESDYLTTELLAVLTAPDAQSPEARLRQIIRTLLSGFGGRHQVRRIVLEQAIARGHNPLITPGHVSTFLTSAPLRDTDGRRVTLSPIEAFVLTRSVMGAIGSALSHNEQWLASAAFEDSLLALIQGFLHACGNNHQVHAASAKT
ncbi:MULTISPECIES: TetR/AcrR family transcriptional regulator [Ralstonia]|nr:MULTISPECIES: TetR/AcrR family transcriptional regulator [unclassified Ralstonia]